MTLYRGSGTPISGSVAGSDSDLVIAGTWRFANDLAIGGTGSNTLINKWYTTDNLITIGDYSALASYGTGMGLYYNCYWDTNNVFRNSKNEQCYYVDLFDGVHLGWRNSGGGVDTAAGSLSGFVDVTGNGFTAGENGSNNKITVGGSTIQLITAGTERLSVATGGIVAGGATGGAQGNGTINCKGLYVDGVVVSSGVAWESDSVVYSGNSGVLTAGSLYTLTMTHGLGTDDVNVEVMAYSLYGATKVDDYVFQWTRPDSMGAYRKGGGNTAHDAQINSSAPSSGDVKIVFKNTYTLDQTIYYKIIITDISGISTGP